MKSFNVPAQYRSAFVTDIKQKRRSDDRYKQDFEPTKIQIGSLNIYLARHFGFCYGVENAIEIAFKAISENPGKRIFLLSEMIHNPGVNADLIGLGVKFIMDTKGNQIISWDDITNNDIVIIPAFGTTLEIEKILADKHIEMRRYETTCPFVEKVWNRAGKIGDEGYTVVVHGKPGHEETRATFSHSRLHTPTVVVSDMKQAQLLGEYIRHKLSAEQFFTDFKGQYSEGFDPTKHLSRIGVVNQTTMLATDTQAIADYLKQTILNYYGVAEDQISDHFADTRDTLCYATNDNQSATRAMLQTPADFALVIGGYNSSNTSHLVELCEEKLKTYFIRDESCLDTSTIRHFDLHQHTEITTENWLNNITKTSWNVLVTSGASCPDALVERVIIRLAELTGNKAGLEDFELG